MAAYTFSCFSIFTRNYEDEEKRVLIRQDVLMFLLQFAAFGTMYLATKDIRILFLYAVRRRIICGQSRDHDHPDSDQHTHIIYNKP